MQTAHSALPGFDELVNDYSYALRAPPVPRTLPDFQYRED
jgi:hypothetical protein